MADQIIFSGPLYDKSEIESELTQTRETRYSKLIALHQDNRNILSVVPPPTFSLSG